MDETEAIHHPHDKFFKRAFEIKEVAADFIGAHMGAEDLNKLDLSTLELQKDSFVDSKFKAYYSDVIYKVNGNKSREYLYFLLEHQSTGDPFIVVRLLQYLANIVNYDVARQLVTDKNKDNLKLPMIRPFVVYSGKNEYKWPQKASINIKGFHLFDLSACLVELRDFDLKELMKSGRAAAAQFILKSSWQRDFCKVLDDNPQLGELINNSPYAKDAIFYMIDQDPHKAKVVNKIRNLNMTLKTKIMNNLQKLREEGKREGMREGELKGLKQAIVKFLAHGMTKLQIAKVLGYTVGDLEKLLA